SISTILPFSSAGTELNNFITSIRQTVSPASTVSPTWTYSGSSGEGLLKNVPTIGALIVYVSTFVVILTVSFCSFVTFASIVDDVASFDFVCCSGTCLVTLVFPFLAVPFIISLISLKSISFFTTVSSKFSSSRFKKPSSESFTSFYIDIISFSFADILKHSFFLAFTLRVLLYSFFLYFYFLFSL